VFAYNWHVPFMTVLEHGVGLPFSLFPRPYRGCEFTEIDFGVEVGGEVAAMATGIDINDVDGFDLIKIGIHRKTSIGIDYTRIKADPQDGGHASLLAVIASFPFVVVVPWRGLAHF